MTKEMLISLYNNGMPIDVVIDTLTDDFENRTCESCKFYQYDSCQKLTYFDGEYEITPINSCPDFGCNKWSNKYD